jgi:hypothetical protein
VCLDPSEGRDVYRVQNGNVLIGDGNGYVPSVPPILRRVVLFVSDTQQYILVVRLDCHLGKRSLPQAEGELTSPSVCEDLFAGPSLQKNF